MSTKPTKVKLRRSNRLKSKFFLNSSLMTNSAFSEATNAPSHEVLRLSFLIASTKRSGKLIAYLIELLKGNFGGLIDSWLISKWFTELSLRTDFTFYDATNASSAWNRACSKHSFPWKSLPAALTPQRTFHAIALSNLSLHQALGSLHPSYAPWIPARCLLEFHT